MREHGKHGCVRTTKWFKLPAILVVKNIVPIVFGKVMFLNKPFHRGMIKASVIIFSGVVQLTYVPCM